MKKRCGHFAMTRWWMASQRSRNRWGKYSFRRTEISALMSSSCGERTHFVVSILRETDERWKLAMGFAGGVRCGEKLSALWMRVRTDEHEPGNAASWAF